MLPRLILSIFIVFLTFSTNVYAENGQKLPVLEEIQASLEELPKSIENNDSIQKMLDKLKAIQGSAQQIISAKTQELADIDAKLSNLADAPKPDESQGPITPEARDIESQRSALQKERERIDANIKLAKLLISEGDQRSLKLMAESRAKFQAELFERVKSPIKFSFWEGFSRSWSSDFPRVQQFMDSVFAIFMKALEPENKNFFYAGIFLSLITAFVLNRLLQNLIRLIAMEKIPTGRARRSLVALGIILNNVIITGLSTYFLYTGLNWNGIVSPDLQAYLVSVIYTIIFASLITGLGNALFSVRHESWRLPPLSNALVNALKPYPWLIATLIVVHQAIIISSSKVGISLGTEVGLRVISNLSMVVLGFLILGKIARYYRITPLDNQDVTSQAPATVWPVILRVLCWIIVIGTLAFTLVGFVALGSFLITQLLWIVIILSTFYILFKLSEDLFQASIAAQGLIGKRLVEQYEITPNFLNQLSTILSGITKLLLFYALVVILLVPFGNSLTGLFNRDGKLDDFLQTWQNFITPGMLLSAIMIILGGAIIGRLLKNWLVSKYFPNTNIDSGVRLSIVTVLGYIVAIITVSLMLSTLGISLEKLTWIASALSVGIGFGLQAIVQNFISGLIMLIERPVKVGDWVVIGTQEGDIRRINVRATEIQLGDRSTLIVPNSEFITKSVRNMTLSKSEGRVQIRLPLPLSVNPAQVRDIILSIFENNEDVLEDQGLEPYIRLDGIEGGNLIMIATCFVISPRLAGRIKSELLFEIINKLHQENILLSMPLQVEQINPVPGNVN